MRRVRRPRLLAFVSAAAMAAAAVLSAAPAHAGTAEITGSVYDQDSGEWLVGACVYVIDEAGADTGASACADDSGVYTLSGLDAGTYRLRVEHAGHETLWAYSSLTLDDADRFDVVDGDTQVVDFPLRAMATLSGTVTAAGSGAPIEGAVVTLDRFDSPIETSTDAAGHYESPPVPVGSYRVRFAHPSGIYLSECYDDHRRCVDADEVTLTAAGPNIANAALSLASRVVGVVTDKDTGAPVEGACPIAFVQLDDEQAPVGVAQCSNAAGRYSVGDLVPGDYYVRLGIPGGSYADTYAPGVVDRNKAKRVHVDDVATVDVQLVPGAAVSGRFVESITGAPMPDVCFGAHYASGHWAGQNAEGCSGADGRYVVRGLPPGVSLRFHIAPSDSNSPYVEQWYNDKHDLESATPITLTAGSAPRTIDAKIARGGAITGIVRSKATGKPVKGICATTGIFHPGLGGTEPHPSACSGKDGRYRIRKVRPGRHKIQFYDVSGTNYAWQFYPGAASPEAGTWVTVKAGATTSSINMRLVTGGTITGVVRDLYGRPLQGIYVESFHTSVRKHAAGGGFTDAKGRFRARGFPTGRFKLLIFDGGGVGPYRAEWYHNKSSWRSATPIQTTAGKSVSVTVKLVRE